ncbi:EthD family reductase [Novosphingobium lentum]|uniref:EthD family reductase n=1 Tax=Novosphingobium lentum TaxID=145287 RepID=UPI00082CA5B1|nr:EthD family reductase [Novosphingobium lentum]
MANIVVSYPTHAGAQFDAAYYTASHIPLVERHWGPLGMTGADVMLPADGNQPFAAMVVLKFRDSASIDAAMVCAGTPDVMADVAKFTNIVPQLYRTAD